MADTAVKHHVSSFPSDIGQPYNTGIKVAGAGPARCGLGAGRAGSCAPAARPHIFGTIHYVAHAENSVWKRIHFQRLAEAKRSLIEN